jgi:predicted GNAT family N-acyltransferase
MASLIVAPAPLGSDLRAACLALRREVFVAEQGVPADLELDDFDVDPLTSHLAALDPDGSVVGTVRWVTEPPGFEGADIDLGEIGHLQRLAVRASARGRGIGAVLVAAVEAEVEQAALDAIYLAAQATALRFYERLNYVAYGAPFVEAGLDHRHMLKRL